tara:strand:- start:853 stop:1554 length:702 start_codon:yes stop_codon:yes gene_type:complete
MYNKNIELFFEFNEKKIIINAFDKNFNRLHSAQINLKNKNKNFINKLEDDIKEIIFKIEKDINSQIYEINVILNLNRTKKIVFNIYNKINQNISKYEDLIYLIEDARQNILKNNKDLHIMHIIIDNFYYDYKKYENYDLKKKHQNFSIDLKFLCYSKKDINEFKDLFGRINLTVNKFMCYEYIKSRKGNSIDDEDYHHEALKVLLGNNDKEVEIVAKKRRNLGLFEKIFHFFS